MHLEDDFDKVDVLNSGTNGFVFLEVFEHTNVTYAVKNFPSHKAFNAGMEVKRLMEIQHPSIVKFHSIILNKDDTFSYSIQYAPNGNVKQKIIDNSLTSTEKSIIALGTSYALQEIHNRNILHLDVKPDNVLLNKNNYPLLCDFRSSYSLSELKNLIDSKLEPVLGSYPYTAPELYNNTKGQKVDFKADVFSFGIFLYNLLTRKQVFTKSFKDEINHEKIYSNYRKNIRPSLDNYEEDDFPIVDLINQCLEIDPENRPTINQIVDYLSDINNVFCGTKEKPFLKYISYVEKHKKSSPEEEFHFNIEKNSLSLSKRAKDAQKSLSCLAFAMSIEQKYKRSLVEAYFKIFKRKNSKQELLVQVNEFFMSKIDMLTAPECFEIADNFLSVNSSFAWNFFDFAVASGNEDAKKKIKKFLSYKKVDITFERFIKYAFQNAEDINENNMFSIDFEQQMNCLFIAKYYIDKRPKDISNPKQKKATKSKSKSKKSKSTNEEPDLNSIESFYDEWIERLVDRNYMNQRRELVEKSEAKKFDRLSDEFQYHMAISGCPTQAYLLSDRKLKQSNMPINKSRSDELKKDYIKYRELSVINGYYDGFESFATELEKGRLIEKDDRRAQRLLFFKSLFSKKKPFQKSDLFTFESFYRSKSSPNGKRKSDSDNDSSYYISSTSDDHYYDDDDNDDNSHYYSYSDEENSIKIKSESCGSVNKRKQSISLTGKRGGFTKSSNDKKPKRKKK